MLIVMGAAVAWGLYKGFAWQVASFAAIVVSYVVAVQMRGPVAEMLDIDPPWNKLVAMLGLFVATSLVIWSMFRLASASIEKFKLKDFDRQIGAVLGGFKGIVACTIITMFAVSFLKAESRQKIVDSKSGYLISQIIDKTHAIMPEEVHNVIHPYFDKFHEQMGDGAANPLVNLETLGEQVPEQLQQIPGQFQSMQNQATQLQQQATQYQQQFNQLQQDNQQQIDAARNLIDASINPPNSQPYSPPNTQQYNPQPNAGYVPSGGVQYIQSNGQIYGQ